MNSLHNIILRIYLIIQIKMFPHIFVCCFYNQYIFIKEQKFFSFHYTIILFQTFSLYTFITLKPLVITLINFI
jgi:hypothetical protein